MAAYYVLSVTIFRFDSFHTCVCCNLEAAVIDIRIVDTV